MALINRYATLLCPLQLDKRSEFSTISYVQASFKKAFEIINGMALDMRFLRRGLNILVAFVNYYTAMAACYSVMSDERGVFEIKDRTSLTEDEISDSSENSDGKTLYYRA